MERELNKISEKLDFIINNYSTDRRLQDSNHATKGRKYRTLLDSIFKKLIDLYFIVDESNQNIYEGIVDKFILVYINLFKINLVNVKSRETITYKGIPIDDFKGISRIKILNHEYKKDELIERFNNTNNLYHNRVYSRILILSSSIQELFYEKNGILLNWVKLYEEIFVDSPCVINFNYENTILSNEELVNFTKLNII
jgi:hypothetical protein